MKNALQNEALRLEEDLLWAEKAHFQAATVWRTLHWVLGLPSAAAGALTGLSAIKGNPSLTAALGIATAVLSSLLTFSNPNKSSKESHSAGVRCSELRSKVRRFREIDLPAVEVPKDARKTIEAFAKEKASIMETTPHTGGIPYWLARKCISKNQHVHAVDIRPGVGTDA